MNFGIVDFKLHLCLNPLKFVFNVTGVYIMKLSIIIPTCDRPHLLKRAVTSALNNGGKGCEVIVVDDGLAKSASSLSFGGDIRVITTSGRTGASAARNLGAHHATGEYILFLDDDDVFQYDYVTDILKHISSTDHKVGACNTSNKTFVTSNTIITKSKKLKHALFGAGMRFWIERELFLHLGGFDEELTIDEDTDFYVRIRANAMPIFVSASVGVSISPDVKAEEQSGRLTRSNEAKKIAESYAKTANKHLSNPNLSFWDKWFLISRSARKVARVQRANLDMELAQDHPLWALIHRAIVFTKQKFGRKREMT